MCKICFNAVLPFEILPNFSDHAWISISMYTCLSFLASGIYVCTYGYTKHYCANNGLISLIFWQENLFKLKRKCHILQFDSTQRMLSKSEWECSVAEQELFTGGLASDWDTTRHFVTLKYAVIFAVKPGNWIHVCILAEQPYLQTYTTQKIKDIKYT